jgi:mycofactocin system glycosyltransferase
MTTTHTYCLRKGVTLQRNGEHCYLVSAFPLRATKLDGRWESFFRPFDDGRPRTLQQLGSPPPGVSAEALEHFLDGLARKGFLMANRTPSDIPTQSVSVIIPVRDRPRDLERCLDSLAAMDYPAELLEVIVVDDASKDETATVAERYPMVTLLRNSQSRGASASRNRGARHASGDILCFVDSDCQVVPLWLREMMVIFDDPAATAGGGLVSSNLESRRLDRYEKVLSSLHMGTRPRDSRDGDRFFYLPSCNLAVRRTDFLQLGGFNEGMAVGEDVDLCWRLVDNGGVIAYRPEAVIFHRHRNRLGAFCRRRYDYGTSEPLLQSLHPRRRKIFPVWPLAMLFWGLLLSAALSYPVLGAVAPLLLLADSLQNRQRAQRRGLRLTFATVLQAKIRHYLSVLYHLAAFCSRYYLLPALAVIVLLPWLGAAFIVGHMAVGMVQYSIKKPTLDPVAFLFFFSLEQISYQAGVWRGCFQQRFFSPVAPRLCLYRMDKV